MQVVIRVRDGLLVAGDKDLKTTPTSRKLNDISAMLGVDMHPIHVGIAIPELASYFGAEVPDMDTAQKLIIKLKETGMVDAAYVKPADELP